MTCKAELKEVAILLLSSLALSHSTRADFVHKQSTSRHTRNGSSSSSFTFSFVFDQVCFSALLQTTKTRHLAFTCRNVCVYLHINLGNEIQSWSLETRAETHVMPSGNMHGSHSGWILRPGGISAKERTHMLRTNTHTRKHKLFLVVY